MNVQLTIGEDDQLIAHLREGAVHTTVAVALPRPGAASLVRALDDAMTHGYGECFWPATSGGHYWWMLRRDAETAEIVVMWSRGGASGWEHVFRATDGASWVAERLHAEVQRLGLGRSPA